MLPYHINESINQFEADKAQMQNKMSIIFDFIKSFSEKLLGPIKDPL